MERAIRSKNEVRIFMMKTLHVSLPSPALKEIVGLALIMIPHEDSVEIVEKIVQGVLAGCTSRRGVF